MPPANYPLDNVLEARSRLGESTLWDAEQNLLYWVDIYNHRVHKFDPTSGQDQFFEVGDVVGPIALAGPSQLIIGQRDRIAFLNTQDGKLTPILTIEADKPDNRFNDGKCDPQGRFWFGSISQDPKQASLYRYDPDGSLQVMETGLTISNGLGWSPDETTFYLTDSAEQKIYAYRFDAAIGSIQDRRVLIDLSDEGAEPDGMAMDAEGCIWTAMWNGWCVIRFDPDGKEMMRVKMPVQCPTCCTFGGQDLTELYITTASVGLSQQEIEQGFYAGDLFRLQTDVVGMPSYHFGQSS
ncbi:SMP-30/gluconolactonase/LRE family protein [Pseudanabaena sp. FACHB-2040]|uniref:SMP-30/gluconolactonase/LRE family protein n=1 Tax=Pseudanabaena sp. FACHB-2040 TaxID=2692859 RepID=UPI00168450F1|nr:SMP-30/gluconolactonase/LRE family protein [Pseudanabaena sp. FACHB-2040]MBD2260887.1 SMP-30/gluconolactonase/LRE family protein [Pseudanabaena sp. FACHB-2040]